MLKQQKNVAWNLGYQAACQAMLNPYNIRTQHVLYKQWAKGFVSSAKLIKGCSTPAIKG